MLTSYTFNENLSALNIIKNLREGNTLILIENFPLSDYKYQSFIKRIGISIKENRNNNGQDIFDVKISKQNNFFRSIANSNLTFPLHTDCADFNSIPNCIGLLCINPANQEQGTSKFVFLKEVLKQLSKEEIQKLTTKKWKFRKLWRSILTIEADEYKICYDRIAMESFSDINDERIEQLNALDKLFENNSFKIKLKKGDLILFRNDLLLHGRTRIDIDSVRLIKRIRFNIET